MPQPDLRDVHVDAILTRMSVAYMQNPANFISTRVFPTVPVEKKSDKYYIYDKNSWFIDEARRRAPSTESAGSGYTLSTSAYDCEVWAFHKDVDDKIRMNADSPLSMDRDATNYVTSRMALRMERQWASDFFATSIWGTDVVGGTNFVQWDNYATSDPIADVETGMRAILAVTGFKPNTLVVGYDVMRYLRHHPDIIDRYKYTNDAVITEAMIARLFGVERLLVAESIYATNVEAETAAYSFVHGKHALLCYVAPSPGLLQPSAGYTFLWNGISSLGSPYVIRRFREERLTSDRIEVEAAFDNKVIGADLGYFFSGAVA